MIHGDIVVNHDLVLNIRLLVNLNYIIVLVEFVLTGISCLHADGRTSVDEGA